VAHKTSHFYYAPDRREGGNKRCFCPSVCPSVAYIANTWRTQRPSVPQIWKEGTLGATHIPVSRSKRQSSRSPGRLMLTQTNFNNYFDVGFSDELRRKLELNLYHTTLRNLDVQLNNLSFAEIICTVSRVVNFCKRSATLETCSHSPSVFLLKLID